MPVRLLPPENEAARAVRQLARGRCNASGSFTCDTSSATTTVTDSTIQVGDIIELTAITANAAAEMASGNLYVTPATQEGQITVNHTNSVTTGRTFGYEVKEI